VARLSMQQPLDGGQRRLIYWSMITTDDILTAPKVDTFI
jgi:hypothetical protein